MATAKNEAATAANATPSDNGLLVPNIGSYETHQELTKRAKVFWCSTINGQKSDKHTKVGMLNPLRGVPTEMRRRKADPTEPDKLPGNYYLVTATAQVVVREEAPNKGEEGKLRLCEIGETVWVDERFAFNDLKKFLPRVVPGVGTVAIEAVCIPRGVIDIGKGKTTLRYEVLGEMISPKRCEELGIGGSILRFLTMGGMQAPAALLTEGGSEEDVTDNKDIPF